MPKTMTYNVRPTTWNAANKIIYKSPQPPARVLCHIPLCIGFTEELEPEKLEALVDDISKKDYGFIIYLSPKDENALKDWYRKNSKVYEENRNNIVVITDWRKNSHWTMASNRYKDFRYGDRKENVANAIQSDVRSFGGRHKDISPEQSEQHILNEVIDCISWMEDKSSNNTTLNCLLYPHNLSNAMRNAFQNAEAMGYIKDSLVHLKFTLEENLELVEVKKSSPDTNNYAREFALEVAAKVAIRDPAKAVEFVNLYCSPNATPHNANAHIHTNSNGGATTPVRNQSGNTRNIMSQLQRALPTIPEATSSKPKASENLANKTTNAQMGLIGAQTRQSDHANLAFFRPEIIMESSASVDQIVDPSNEDQQTQFSRVLAKV